MKTQEEEFRKGVMYNQHINAREKILEYQKGFDCGRTQAFDEFEKMIDEFEWKLNDVNNKWIEEAVYYNGNEVFMEKHNESLDMLKDKLKEAQKK
jgi:hypothetical protein